MKYKQTITIFLLQNSALGINLMTQFILTSLLPLNIFGMFAKVYVVRDILLPFLSFSLGMSLIFNPTKDKKALVATATFLSFIQVLIIFIGGFIISFILFLIKYFDYKDFILMLILLGTSGLNVFYLVFFSLFERDEKFVFNSIISIVVALFSSSIVIFTAINIKNILPLLLREFLPIFFLFVIYSIIVVKKHGSKTFVKQNIDKVVLKNMIDYSLKMYLSRSVEAFFLKLDMLIVSRLFPKEIIGLYERARYFASLGWSTIANYINRVHFVKYIHTADLSLFKKTNYYSSLLNFVLFAASIGIIFFLSVATGKETWHQILLLMPFFLHFVVGALVENFKTYFYAKGEVIYAMLTLRIIPLVILIISIIILYFSHNINIYNIAFLSALSYLSSILVLRLFPKLSLSNNKK